MAAIDHIEVLQDGAAAQYGTGAIAGVINIILKKDSQGGSLTATGGRYFDQGGKTGDAAVNLGFAPGADSFVNFSAETRYHGHSDRGSIDPRVASAANQAAMPNLLLAPGYPYLNHIAGDAAYHIKLLALNSGVDLGGGTGLYATNATYGKKTADAFENYRTPNRPPKLYPFGFDPRETMDETDFGVSAGIKGSAGVWNWDLSTTYGKDKAEMGVANSANISLYKDTGATPLDFRAGDFTATQWTTNLDVNREFAVGWSSPLNLALGLEYRKDGYQIGAGDAASRYKEGSQSSPCFSLTDASDHRRNDKAVYIVLDPTVTQTGINIFTNGANTRNTGLELLLSYASNYGDMGRVDWSAAGNYNKVEITRINQAPAQLLPQVLLNLGAIASLESSSPKARVNFGALWKNHGWTVNLRESVYGPSSGSITVNGTLYFKSEIKTAATTDLEISQQLTKSLTLAVGANNLFNKYPDRNNADLIAAQNAALNTGSVNQYPGFSPFGINGGYYYGRVNYSF